MAVDKLVDSTQLDADLTSIANAIRTKGGTSAQLAFPADFISAINAISGGGGGGEGYTKYATGTYTPAQTYNTAGNRQITTIDALGFTPKKFVIGASDRSSISTTQYALLVATYEAIGSTPLYARNYIRYQNTSGTLGNVGHLTSWTTQTDGHLYLNSGKIYWRTAANAILVSGVTYAWYAYGD